MLKKKLTTEEFIKRAKAIHGNTYDYSKVEYVNSKTKVIITCPVHGDFEQLPHNHLRGCGCDKCAQEEIDRRARLTKEQFIKKARKVHGNMYNYSKTNYINNRTKVVITCPIHGDFEQRPDIHLNGHGCLECGGNKKSTTEEFIKKAREVHGNKYNYNKTNYINSYSKVTITCPIHGDFEQIAWNHLVGNGCPHCKSSKLEESVRDALEKNNIDFIPQGTWDWLVYKDHQYVDFYLPRLNVVIECQGEQHFKAVNFFGGEEGFKSTVDHDKNKLKLCTEHGIKVLYVADLGDNYGYPYEVLNIENLVNKLLELVRLTG